MPNTETELTAITDRDRAGTRALSLALPLRRRLGDGVRDSWTASAADVVVVWWDKVCSKVAVRLLLIWNCGGGGHYAQYWLVGMW